MFKVLLQSVLLYGTETWAIIKEHGEKLSTVEMDFWRRSARISRKDTIRNTRIIEIRQVDKNVLEIILATQINCRGAVVEVLK